MQLFEVAFMFELEGRCQLGSVGGVGGQGGLFGGSGCRLGDGRCSFGVCGLGAAVGEEERLPFDLYANARESG